jgi:ribosomal protein S18 acetylase RimI-like enzyme
LPTAPDCRIRTLRPDEVAQTIELAAREGWNPGLHDAACFATADPEGFIGAEVDGRLAGCISAVRYGSGFGFIGLYIVVPEWRGHGIGWRLWQQAVQRLQGRLVGLDGVPAQQANYRKSGFQLAWQNMRYAGVAGAASGEAGPGIVPLAQLPFDAVCESDARVFPAPREAFLRAWCQMPDATALACVDGTRLLGWGVIRRCREGHKIAPLVADTPAVAERLYAALGARVNAGDAVFLDVPLPNTEAQALAARHGLRGVFETARMYTGAAPPCALHEVFGITSFELG